MKAVVAAVEPVLVTRSPIFLNNHFWITRNNVLVVLSKGNELRLNNLSIVSILVNASFSLWVLYQLSLVLIPAPLSLPSSFSMIWVVHSHRMFNVEALLKHWLKLRVDFRKLLLCGSPLCRCFFLPYVAGPLQVVNETTLEHELAIAGPVRPNVTNIISFMRLTSYTITAPPKAHHNRGFIAPYHPLPVFHSPVVMSKTED